MTESLLSPSTVFVFGRVIGGLTLDQSAIDDNGSFLGKQLNAAKAKLARIYGFSFEGQYVDVLPPAIFLVQGDGVAAGSDADISGLAFQDETFASGMMMWSHDKDDFTMRLDTFSGTFEDVLLAPELDDMMAFGGTAARGTAARGTAARGTAARGTAARGTAARGTAARGGMRGSSD